MDQQVPIALTAVLAALAALRFLEARRSVRQAQAQNLLNLNETWQSLQEDWRRSLFLVSGQDSYYFSGTSAEIEAMNVIASYGRSPRFADNFNPSSNPDSPQSPMGGLFQGPPEFHEAEALFLDSAQRVLMFFGTVTELVLAGQVRVGDAYASFGFDAARRSGALRLLLEGGGGARWTPSTRALHKVEGWATYNPGVVRRTRIFVDLMWAQAARTGDLSPAFLMQAASTKLVYQSGAKNRRRVRQHLRRSYGWWRGRWLAPRHMIHLRRAEFRSWLNPWGLPRARLVDDVSNWLAQRRPLLALELIEDWGRNHGAFAVVDSHSQEWKWLTDDCAKNADVQLPGTADAEVLTEARHRLATLLAQRSSSRRRLAVATIPNPNVPPGLATSKAASVCILLDGRSRRFYPPRSLGSTPLAAIFQIIETDRGSRISEIRVVRSGDEGETASILVDHLGWPPNTAMRKYLNLSAKSWRLVDD